MKLNRRYPIGAELLSAGGAHFRVWAPSASRVALVIEGDATRAFPLEPEGNGYFSGIVALAWAGTLYRFRLDNDSTAYPDPASRFQPEGPHGPSQVIDPFAFKWSDTAWPGVKLESQVIYELHLGTFTREGTWAAAAEQLGELADLGITLVEIMPVADFPGKFGWGYDGVNLFAPCRLYGRPEDFRRFVDRAHALGVGVILDVVYNHFGPDGNYLSKFSEHYITHRHDNEWGDAINFDDPHSDPVREFFLTNARYWIDEFHLDGLRLDATHSIHDHSSDHILAAISREARQAAGKRSIVIVAEDESQRAHLVRLPEKGGYALDAVWNDDFHHASMVALTGHNEAYYSDYHGTPQEFISTLKWGYLYQGQIYSWQKKARGSPALDLLPARFVNFIQNHDQVANSGQGLRINQLCSPGRFRAMTALLLLAPSTPMLFQGQEFAASSPFLYFADHHPQLNAQVAKGRREFLAQFPSLATPEAQDAIPDPGDPATFQRCILDLSQRRVHQEIYDLHRDLLRMRREDPAFQAQRYRGIDGAVLGPHAFALRFFAQNHADRLLVVNLGRDLHLQQAPEPLLAPPISHAWEQRWSSEEVRYGGNGTPALETSEDNWRVPGEAAVILAPRRVDPPVLRGHAHG